MFILGIITGLLIALLIVMVEILLWLRNSSVIAEIQKPIKFNLSPKGEVIQARSEFEDTLGAIFKDEKKEYEV